VYINDPTGCTMVIYYVELATTSFSPYLYVSNVFKAVISVHSVFNSPNGFTAQKNIPAKNLVEYLEFSPG
jgi:hypothetical protein